MIKRCVSCKRQYETSHSRRSYCSFACFQHSVRPKWVDEGISLYKDGWTLQEIGDRYSVSKQRVQQLFKIAKVRMRPKGPRVRT